MRTKWFFAVTTIVAGLFLFSSCDDEEYNEEKISFQSQVLNESGYWNGSDGSGSFRIGIATFSNTFTDWGGGYTSWDGFALSNITDIQTTGLSNQYSAFVLNPSNTPNIYAICYVYGDNAKIIFDQPVQLSSLLITNSTYTYWSMKNGDLYSKKFGGVSGADPDWLKLTVKGYNTSGEEVKSAEFYLADYQFASPSNDYIIDNWQKVDLSLFDDISELRFYLSSSDTSDFGMNTPAYFCLDNLVFRY